MKQLSTVSANRLIASTAEVRAITRRLVEVNLSLIEKQRESEGNADEARGRDRHPPASQADTSAFELDEQK
jgi:hypothetical protein